MGELKAIEVLEHHLERIDRFNPALNAFVHLDPDRALATATEIDRRVAAGGDPGPLGGVPLGIKELESVEGWPETHASTAYKDCIAIDHHDDEHAPACRRRGARRPDRST